MGDKGLYAQILGIGSPWQVEAVDLRLHASEIHIVVGLARGKHAAVPLYILESSVAVVPGALKRGLGRAGVSAEYRILNIEQGILKWWWAVRYSLLDIRYSIFGRGRARALAHRATAMPSRGT